MSILEKLKKEEIFTTTELTIVKYIKNHLVELPNLSIGELTKKLILLMLQLFV